MPATDHNGLAITNPATQDAYLAVQSANITRIKGVEDDDMPTIQKLLTTWRDHYARNMLRAEYYQARYRYNGVAYSIPKQMRALAKPMIGWPNKAVRALADLNVFEGFDAPTSTDAASSPCAKTPTNPAASSCYPARPTGARASGTADAAASARP